MGSLQRRRKENSYRGKGDLAELIVVNRIHGFSLAESLPGKEDCYLLPLGSDIVAGRRAPPPGLPAM